MKPSWSLEFTLFNTATPEIVGNVYPRATVSTNSSQSSPTSSSVSPSVLSSHSSSSESLAASAASSSSNFSAATPSSTFSTPSPSLSPPPPSPPPPSPPPPPPPSSTSSIIPFQASPTISTSSPEITSQTPIPSPVISINSSTGTNTSLSSTSANITVTVVVSSNPTNDLSPPQQDTSRQGFFSHTGGVAGTFLVIGLFTTSLFLCFFFWIKRRIRRKRASRRVYMQDNYRSLTHSLDNDRQTTPEPRASRRSLSANRQNSTSALTHSKNNSVERIPFPLMNSSPYQAEPGEYDPYKPEAVNKVYSNDYAEASEYQKYLNRLTD